MLERELEEPESELELEPLLEAEPESSLEPDPDLELESLLELEPEPLSSSES